MRSPVGVDARHAPRNVVHVVAQPVTGSVACAVLAILRRGDRERWYPSLLVEPPPAGAADPVGEQLADAARSIGVPVMTTRARCGDPAGDWWRTLLDAWFHVRNADPALVHVHSGLPVPCRSPLATLRRVVRAPVITTIHPPAGGVAADADPYLVHRNTDAAVVAPGARDPSGTVAPCR